MNLNSLRPCGIAAVLLTGIIVSTAIADDAPGDKKAAKKRRPVNVFAGRVLSAEDNKPVAGVKVVVADAEEGYIGYSGPEFIYSNAPEDRVLFFFRKRNGRKAGETVTDKQGKFEFKSLAKSGYALLAVHKTKGLAVLEKVEHPDKGELIDVVLQRPVFVEGIVKGVGGEGQHLRLHRADTKESNIHFDPVVSLDKDGGFRVGPLPDIKQWNLTAEMFVMEQAYSATLWSVPVETKAGETTKVSVNLSTGSTFSGEVRGPKREVLSGVSVVARTVKEPAFQYGAITDSKGKYTLAGLPDGDYVLEAKRWAIRTAPG